MFVGVMVVNGLILFNPHLVCAEEQSEEVGGAGQQEEEAGKLTTGMINSFDGEDAIVISDVTFHYSNGTRFYNRNGSRIAVSSLQVNDLVGFLSVDGMLVEVRAMNPEDVEANRQPSLPVDSANEDGTANEQNKGQSAPVHIEGGVWKN
ncbi:MAG: hypothetical protein KJ990_10355 [Proteobacteria bacterium]|nr:hypothetical protein [Pseudomonadota bacterium]MBU1648803.1 hypothetical protein [Pseudomonadota bacterium]